jgi:hypothetical protein
LHALLAIALPWLPTPDSPDASRWPWGEPEQRGREIDVPTLDILDLPPVRERVVMASASGGTAEIPSVEPPAPGTHSPAADGASLPAPLEQSSVSGNGSGESPAGQSQEPGLFPVPASARSVVYVIDRSSSMGLGNRLDLARRELAASLRRLPETTAFQIVVYNRRAEALPISCQTGLVPATDRNIGEAVVLLDQLVPEGSTEHREGVRQALLLEPELIFVLTDAAELTQQDVQALTRLNRGRSGIHVVELRPDDRQHADCPAKELARWNRGSYRAVDIVPSR